MQWERIEMFNIHPHVVLSSVQDDEGMERYCIYFLDVFWLNGWERYMKTLCKISLDKSLPLWNVHAVQNVGGGKSCLIFNIHHAIGRRNVYYARRHLPFHRFQRRPHPSHHSHLRPSPHRHYHLHPNPLPNPFQLHRRHIPPPPRLVPGRHPPAPPHRHPHDRSPQSRQDLVHASSHVHGRVPSNPIGCALPTD
ncbi:hypothetical protein BC829DRAFT_5693 [Chytridium lagenaria]|nr:hypothetical protein BC829DRAFT_5693 [Chytridium lagenaria]